jgi:hypothetical protein
MGWIILNEGAEMTKLFSLLCLALSMLISGCWLFGDTKDNPCVEKKQVCCVVDTGPSHSVQMCTPTAAACLAQRPASAIGAYPMAKTSTAINDCPGG